MESTVKSRPNHYERLGLSPTATSEEIAQAFARETSVFRPQPFGGISELCVAFETLRNPVKRRAYDESIGIAAPKPPAPTVGPRWSQRLPASASSRPIGQPFMQTGLPPAAKPGPTPRPDPVAEKRLDPGDAASLRRPVQHDVRESSPSPLRKPDSEPEAQLAGMPLRHHGLDEQLGVEVRPIEWKRPGIAAGTIAVAACIVGTLVGWWSVSDMGQRAQPENAVSVPLPPAKRVANAAAPKAASTASLIDAQALSAGITARPATRPARRPVVRQAAVKQESLPEIRPEESRLDQIASGLDTGEQPAAAEPAVSTAAAMPLPNKTIARTIQRIGYACGSVASTSPVEGEVPGVYKVTCASGHTYQARPVNGRYRFRRMGRN